MSAVSIRQVKKVVICGTEHWLDFISLLSQVLMSVRPFPGPAHVKGQVHLCSEVRKPSESTSILWGHESVVYLLYHLDTGCRGRASISCVSITCSCSSSIFPFITTSSSSSHVSESPRRTRVASRILLWLQKSWRWYSPIQCGLPYEYAGDCDFWRDCFRTHCRLNLDLSVSLYSRMELISLLKIKF